MCVCVCDIDLDFFPCLLCISLPSSNKLIMRQAAQSQGKSSKSNSHTHISHTRHVRPVDTQTHLCTLSNQAATPGLCHDRALLMSFFRVYTPFLLLLLLLLLLPPPRRCVDPMSDTLTGSVLSNGAGMEVDLLTLPVRTPPAAYWNLSDAFRVTEERDTGSLTRSGCCQRKLGLTLATLSRCFSDGASSWRRLVCA